MKTWRVAYMVGSVVMATTIVGTGTAFAAGNPSTHPSAQTSAQMEAQWQQAIGNLRAPGRGCYRASYPALAWHATRCEVAPDLPLAPRLQAVSGVPQLVGDGKDYSAKVSGKITKATGSFEDVSKGITEKGKVDDGGSKLANTFSLQLNTQFFSTPVCSGSADPSKCLGWQQFLYTTSPNDVFMQYWLLYWNTTCPDGWHAVPYGEDTFCYVNSSSVTFTGGPLTAKDLATVKVVGEASSGGNDQVTVSNGSGTAISVTNSDSELDLASYWNTTEWGVFGDGGGGEAIFGAKTTLEARTTIVATSSAAPKCVKASFTAEYNNLDLTKTAAIGTESSPTMASEQTNSKATKASCAVAA